MARPASRKAVSSLPAIANIDEQLDEVVMDDIKSQWISVDERLPESQKDIWSKDVIALSDSGDVFRLACMGEYWQRSKAFVDSGANRITHWMPLIYPDD